MVLSIFTTYYNYLAISTYLLSTRDTNGYEATCRLEASLWQSWAPTCLEMVINKSGSSETLTTVHRKCLRNC